MKTVKKWQAQARQRKAVEAKRRAAAKLFHRQLAKIDAELAAVSASIVPVPGTDRHERFTSARERGAIADALRLIRKVRNDELREDR